MNYLPNLFNLLSNKFYFKISYLLISLFTITILRFIPGVHIINKILILWGLFLIPVDFFLKLSKKHRPLKVEIIIYTLLISTLIFTIIKYPTIDNLKGVILNFIILTIFFDINTDKNLNTLKKELNLFCYIYIGITLLLSIVSLAIIFSREKIWISETLNGEYLVHSFTSAFLNENSLGISSVISFMISIYITSYIKNKNTVKKAYKIIIFFNIILQSTTLILSNSRSVYLAILAFSLILILIYSKNILFKIIIISFSILSSVILFITKSSSINSFLTGRDTLWKASLNIVKSSPIFGLGSTALTNSLDELNLLTLGRVHNIYLEIAATNGLITLFLFILILISTYLFILNKLNILPSKDRFNYGILCSSTISILFINLVESNLFYIMSFISIIFWTILSYTFSILHKV
ncbi:O-antigen ligase family protein [Clostridium sp.]|uniref:O-antigen ligase family protein n=1 Tax=Clostridium sp. TaxID=1506 RepID=UPI00261F9962|nr:O-antigen ligase family protein [Clostridium sp.]